MEKYLKMYKGGKGNAKQRQHFLVLKDYDKLMYLINKS